MIGPAPGRQICPECDGEGEQRRGEYEQWDDVRGEYRTVGVYAPCDVCRGSGRVTKRLLKELEAL